MSIKEKLSNFVHKNNRFFFKIGLIGFIVSAIVHIFTFFGVRLIRMFPEGWLLGMGIFLVWFPAMVAISIERKGFRGYNFWSIITSCSPKWMRIVAISIVIYTFINFFYIIELMPGTPDIIDNTYVIQNHGIIVKKLSYEEYLKYKSYELRLFSGHWIVFYYIGMLILFSSLKTDSLKDKFDDTYEYRNKHTQKWKYINFLSYIIAITILLIWDPFNIKEEGLNFFFIWFVVFGFSVTYFNNKYISIISKCKKNVNTLDFYTTWGIARIKKNPENYFTTKVYNEYKKLRRNMLISFIIGMIFLFFGPFLLDLL